MGINMHSMLSYCKMLVFYSILQLHYYSNTLYFTVQFIVLYLQYFQ